jgi:hypothetical protein
MNGVLPISLGSKLRDINRCDWMTPEEKAFFEEKKDESKFDYI